MSTDGGPVVPAGTKVGTFVPAWWIPGAHPQTLWGKLAGRGDLPAGKLEAWDTPDDDFLQVFRVAGSPGGPRLLLLHGLEGGLDSHYARGIMTRAIRAGWSVDFLLFRGCGTEFNRAPRLYHSGETGDLHYVLHRLVAEHPTDPVVLAGYSLGGNVLLKWLGEQGTGLPPTVRAAAAVSVPYDLSAGARYISQGFSRIYERYFLRTLQVKAARKLEQFPGLYDGAAAARASTIFEFDEAVTARLHGFAGADDYYARSSSMGFLSRIALPTLLISAYDDPFLPPDALAAAARVAADNPALSTAFSPKGGHVGFVAGAVPGAPRYHSEDRLMEFFGRYVRSAA